MGGDTGGVLNYSSTSFHTVVVISIMPVSRGKIEISVWEGVVNGGELLGGVTDGALNSTTSVFTVGVY